MIAKSPIHSIDQFIEFVRQADAERQEQWERDPRNATRIDSSIESRRRLRNLPVR